MPPLWPALYPPGRSSLHHAQQLQLFSQQHFLRQQEFLYLQQQAAQALELQRSAQLVVSWGGRGHRKAVGTVETLAGAPLLLAKQRGQPAESPVLDCESGKMREAGGQGGPPGGGGVCPET